MISPQFGQGNFVASVSGGIVLWHDVHVGMVIVVVVSVMLCPFLLVCYRLRWLLIFAMLLL
jgi:hypothetical protein